LGAPDLARVEDLTEKARSIAEAGRVPTAVVFTIDNMTEVSRDRGTAFVNQALARLFGSLREAFPRASIGQVPPTDLAVVTDGLDSDEAEQITKEAMDQAEAKCGGLVAFAAGLFSGPVERESFGGDNSDLDKVRALDFARYAASREGRARRVSRFSPLTGSNVLLAHRRAKRYSEALADYRALVELGVQYSYLENQLALCLFERDDQDLEAAEVATRRAIGLDSSEGIFWANLGLILFAAGKRDEAHDAFSQAHTVDEGFATPEAYRPLEALSAWRKNEQDPGAIPAEQLRRLFEAALDAGRPATWYDDDELRRIAQELGVEASLLLQ
jgi:tetratricopeptide (TPR) repeat protein